MENGFFLEKLASLFAQNASVKNVYGEPIKTGDKTIIPVAQIAYGLGGGFGKGGQKNKTDGSERSQEDKGTSGEGAGGGGGMYARPKGVYEITPFSTRFIPSNNAKQLVTGLAIGFLIRGWIQSKRRRRLKDSGKS
jgi:uncharacterized spore protein YtfJ